MKQRKRYSKEFKLDAVKEAARSLGINVQMLGRWVKEHQSGGGQVFRGNGKVTAEQEEIRALKARVSPMLAVIFHPNNGMVRPAS